MIAKVAGGMVTASGAMEMPAAEVRSATGLAAGSPMARIASASPRLAAMRSRPRWMSSHRASSS